mgnify:CR=1 FL=1
MVAVKYVTTLHYFGKGEFVRMSTSRRIENRRKAKKALSEFISYPDDKLIIHYSCESFADKPDGSSPRITSIAVRHLGSGQTTSFSIHQIAEREGHSIDAIEKEYNVLEKMMLDEFYKYVSNHQKCKWLHWNMRDINYGFQALDHRYKVLKGNPIEISESHRFDLSRLLIDIYGNNYIEQPRLQKLMEKNKINNEGFLKGEDEPAAFKNKEYVKLHQSTLRKVNILDQIIKHYEKGTLKTNANGKDIYGGYAAAIGEILKEHWLATIIGFISAIGGIFAIVIQILPK